MRAGTLAGTELETRLANTGGERAIVIQPETRLNMGAAAARKKERGVSVYTELLSKGMDGQWARVGT